MRPVITSIFLFMVMLFDAGLAFSAVDDQTLSPPEWRECSMNTDCKIFLYGCNQWAASNSAHFDEAKNLMFLRGGNPATMKCAPPQETSAYTGVCVDKQCTAIPSD